MGCYLLTYINNYYKEHMSYSTSQLASILEKKDEKLRFYQSLERIANGALSEEVDGSESVGQALKQVVTQLAKDACTWVRIEACISVALHAYYTQGCI